MDQRSDFRVSGTVAMATPASTATIVHQGAATGILLIAAGLLVFCQPVLPRVLRLKAQAAVTRIRGALDGQASAEERLAMAGEAGGLLTLLVLSLAAALAPWLGQANPGISVAYSLISLALPAAALRASTVADRVTDAADPDSARLRSLFPPRPTPAPDPRVAIIGGGFSGTMLAVHLARGSGAQIMLVDPGHSPGHGLAYGSAASGHLLNVRAGRMSAYPEDPAHFIRWLTARGLGGAEDFVPRQVYGQYLEQQLRQAHAEVFPRLKLIRAKAVDLRGAGGRHNIALDDGRSISAETVVLATGNPQPPALPAFAGLPPAYYRPDPWQPGIAEGLGVDDTILLVGTGLTMLDMAVTLDKAGYAGRILAVSRRGLLPRCHAEAHAPPSPFEPAPDLPLSSHLAAMRIRAAEIGWQAAMDELRPFTQRLWKELGPAEKARFLRHLRPWWDVHRHRVAPEIARRIECLREAGRFESAAGAVESAELRYGRVVVKLRPRGADDIRRLDVSRIVNCTGADNDLQRTADPLLKRLRETGAIRADPHRLGLDTGRGGEAIGGDGRPTPGLYALGPLARGRLWEATAVPELRAEAAAMAALLHAS